MVGTLKGYDQLMNLVLDDVKELLRGKSLRKNPQRACGFPHFDFWFKRVQYTNRTRKSLESTDDEGNESSRSLGLIVARGTLLVLISPLDGSEQIQNPFNNAGEEED